MSNKKRTHSTKRKHFKTNRQGQYVAVSIILALILLCVCVFYFFPQKEKSKSKNQPAITMKQSFIQKNKYSRPGIKIKKVNSIVVHYTANPGVNAKANRNYFNNLPSINSKKTKKTYASSHFVVGIKGDIIQCIPLDEMSYASNNRNSDTISIECCHRDKTGEFTSETYQSLLELVHYLCVKFDLTEQDVIRHYDVTGKNCPKYFVENPDAWKSFLNDVKKKLESN